MKLNQLADQLHAKTIHLIAITQALELIDLSNPHGGTPLSPDQAQQITAVFRYMRERQMTEPKSAIAQMKERPAITSAIAISIPESVAAELCRRYPEGSMSERILRLLGALQALEQMYELCMRSPAVSAPINSTPSQ